MRPKKGHVPDSNLRGFLDKRIPSRDKIERIRAAGIVAEDEWVEAFADVLLDVRRGVRGGSLNPKGSRHWDD